MSAASIRIVRGVVAVIALLLGGLMVGRTLLRDTPSGTSVAEAGRDGAGGSLGPAPADLATRLQTASATRGAAVFARCAACHSIGRDGPDLDGPNLFGVVGAPVAQRRRRFAYTAALRQKGGSWDAARLDAWLTQPRLFAPGSSMSFPGLPDPRERADVIAFLQAQGSNLRSP